MKQSQFSKSISFAHLANNLDQNQRCQGFTQPLINGDWVLSLVKSNAIYLKDDKSWTTMTMNKKIFFRDAVEISRAQKEEMHEVWENKESNG